MFIFSSGETANVLINHVILEFMRPFVKSTAKRADADNIKLEQLYH